MREHRPSGRDGDVFLLGIEADGRVGAVSAWSHYADPGRVLLQLIAVSIDHRGRGSACAKEAMARTLELITDQAGRAGAARLLLEAHIHRENDASKRLFAEAGFIQDSLLDNGYELWACLRRL